MGAYIYALLLLATYEDYLPYMSDADILDMLEYGQVPAPWKVTAWKQQREAERSAFEQALKAAKKRQKL